MTLSGIAEGMVQVVQSESENVLTVSPMPLKAIAETTVVICAFEPPEIEQGFSTWAVSRHSHWE